MYSPFILATLTSEIGQSQGMSETLNALEAANAAYASGITPSSAESKVI
jgi:hypothetical protein